jgi:hypothetical protein
MINRKIPRVPKKKQLGAKQLENLLWDQCATLYRAETWGKDPFCFILFVVPPRHSKIVNRQS